MYDEWVPAKLIFFETDAIAAAERTCGVAGSASTIYLTSGYCTDDAYVTKDVRKPDTDLYFNGISTSKIWADFLNSLPYEFQNTDSIYKQVEIIIDAYIKNELPYGSGVGIKKDSSLISVLPGQVSPELVIEALYNLVYPTPFNTQDILEFLEKEK